MFIRTKNSNRYWFSEKEKQFLYYPDILERGSYKNKKDNFMKSNNLAEEIFPDFILNYDSNRLKVNLANLRMLMINCFLQH